MRKLLSILLLASCADAAITLVQHKSVSGTSGTSATQTFSSACTVGSSLFVIIRANSSFTVTISDPTNGTWPAADVTGTDTTGTVKVYIFHIDNNQASTALTITAAFSGSLTPRWTIMEVTGLASSSSLDKTAHGDNGSSNSPASGATATTTVANEFWLGATETGANNATFTAGSGWTLQDTPPSNGSGKFADETRIVTTTGAADATFSLGASDTWTAVVATYHAPSSTAYTPATSDTLLTSDSAVAVKNPGGTNYTRTSSDTLLTSDSVGTAVGRFNAVSVTEYTYTFDKQQGQAISISTYENSVTFGAQANDSAATVYHAGGVNHQVNTSELLLLLDAGAGHAQHFGATSDGTLLVESAAAQAAHFGAVSDRLVVFDSSAGHSQHFGSVSDTLALAEKGLAQAAHFGSVSDRQTVTDMASTAVGRFNAVSVSEYIYTLDKKLGGAVSVLAFENATGFGIQATDSAATVYRAGHAINTAELLSAYDAAAGLAVHFAASSERVFVTDRGSTGRTLTAVTFDMLAIGDVAGRQAAHLMATLDTGGTFDVGAERAGHFRSFSDTLIPSDLAAALKNAGGVHYSSTTVEYVFAMESATRLAQHVLAVSDPVGVRDVTFSSVGRVRSVFDAMRLIDTSASHTARQVSTLDTVGLIDAVAAKASHFGYGLDITITWDSATGRGRLSIRKRGVVIN